MGIGAWCLDLTFGGEAWGGAFIDIFRNVDARARVELGVCLSASLCYI